MTIFGRRAEPPAPKVRLCTCGSGLQSFWQYDARNIPLCRTCAKCHDKAMRRYRPDIFTDPNY